MEEGGGSSSSNSQQVVLGVCSLSSVSLEKSLCVAYSVATAELVAAVQVDKIRM